MGKDSNDRRRCVLCSKVFEEFGHDAEPVARGRCCNRCNTQFVIPVKLRQQRAEQEVPTTGL
jgi:hypothetical protein